MAAPGAEELGYGILGTLKDAALAGEEQRAIVSLAGCVSPRQGQLPSRPASTLARRKAARIRDTPFWEAAASGNPSRRITTADRRPCE